MEVPTSKLRLAVVDGMTIEEFLVTHVTVLVVGFLIERICALFHVDAVARVAAKGDEDVASTASALVRDPKLVDALLATSASAQQRVQKHVSPCKLVHLYLAVAAVYPDRAQDATKAAVFHARAAARLEDKHALITAAVKITIGATQHDDACPKSWELLHEALADHKARCAWARSLSDADLLAVAGPGALLQFEGRPEVVLALAMLFPAPVAQVQGCSTLWTEWQTYVQCYPSSARKLLRHPYAATALTGDIRSFVPRCPEPDVDWMHSGVREPDEDDAQRAMLALDDEHFLRLAGLDVEFDMETLRECATLGRVNTLLLLRMEQVVERTTSCHEMMQSILAALAIAYDFGAPGVLTDYLQNGGLNGSWVQEFLTRRPIQALDALERRRLNLLLVQAACPRLDSEAHNFLVEAISDTKSVHWEHFRADRKRGRGVMDALALLLNHILSSDS